MFFTKWLLLYELCYIKNQALQSVLDILVYNNTLIRLIALLK